jgi:hypothetical protein
MQNAGRGIWRKFSGLSRERRDAGFDPTVNMKNLIFSTSVPPSEPLELATLILQNLNEHPPVTTP